MSGLRNISALKLRLGAGKTGQQEFDNNYPYLARYDMSTNVYNQYYMGSDGYMFFLTPRPYDPLIRWETTTTYNVGLDFGFLNGRVNGSVDWYNRITDDLLNEVFTPMGANFGNTLLTNIGSMRNTGVEFAVNVAAVQTQDFNMEIGFNGTFQKTEFTKLNATDDPTYAIPVTGVTAGTGGTIAQHVVGYAPYTFYPFQQVYDANGNPVQNALVDRDSDGTISQADRYMSGKSPSPDFYYGMNLKLTYRRWDFGFNGHGSVGNWVFNDFASNHATSFIDINAGNLPNFANTVLKTSWTGANISEQSYSDLFIEDASFFKMDDVNLGYTFENLFAKRGSVRLGFSVQNVFTITGYSGVDPEIPGVEGKDSAIWPRPRTYSLRLNVNF
jgi:iron complex outermembrane receptor protein